MASSTGRKAEKTIVLVSGANTGIGYEIVKKLAAENPSSYQILMGCRDTSKGESACVSLGAPQNVNPIQLDVTSDESVEQCAKTIEQHFGKLDVLINNAGTAGKATRREGNSTLRQVYDEVYRVNVVGTAVLTEAVVPLLEKSTLPRIVFITSQLGSIADVLSAGSFLVDVPFYSSSKAAVNYLTAFYSRKYADKGWKVNACCPGLRATGLNDAEMTEEQHPRNGAINAVRLATAGPEGETGTYSNKEGIIPW